MQIHFNPVAIEEIRDSKNWYESQKKGLGIEFVLHVDEAIRRIQLYPNMYPVFLGQIRKTLVQKFPYSIIYEFTDSEIHILAVFHSKRDPEHWQSRI